MSSSNRRLLRISAFALLLVAGLAVGLGAAGAAAEPNNQTDIDFENATVPDAVGVDVPFVVDATAIEERDDVTDVCWKFDESNTCHGAEINHSFESAEYHTTTLIVTDDDGEYHSTTWLVVATTPPVAQLTAPERVKQAAEIQLNASESADDYGIESYEWDLNGDGTIDETTASPTIDYAFETAGTHDVTVTTVDAAGQTDTANATVEAVEPVGNSAASSDSKDDGNSGTSSTPDVSSNAVDSDADGDGDAEASSDADGSDADSGGDNETNTDADGSDAETSNSSDESSDADAEKAAADGDPTTPSEEVTEPVGQPGFGAVTATLALLAVGLSRLRRRR